MNRRRLAFTVIAAAAVLSAVGVALYFSPKAEPGSTQPPIAWTPGQLVLTLTPGESRQLQVTANVRSAIPAVVAEVVPALALYVSVSPAALSPMAAAASQVFDLTLNVPAGTSFQTIEGTLHLRAGESTVARPLPIVLNIWPTVQMGASKFSYPPEWTTDSVVELELTAAEARSPSGSSFLLLPEGGFPYDLIGDEFEEVRHMDAVGGFTTLRRDFLTSDGVFLVRLEFLDVPGHPDFRVELRPRNPQDRGSLETMLRTLVIEPLP